MVPANVIGTLTNCPVLSIDEFYNQIIQTKGDRVLKQTTQEIINVLIVDDSINFGRAYDRIMKKLPEIYSGKPYNFDFMAIYDSENTPELDVFALKRINTPRLFQWNYRNHIISQNSCYDIDGVLCVDPTDEENDDGDKYINFILTAKPLYIPNYKIKALVTSRLEKYRNETETWLKKNDVKYEKLYMLDLPSKEERIRQKMHGKFKSEIYSMLTNTILFIESNKKQALEISKITKKPVLCIEDDKMYN